MKKRNIIYRTLLVFIALFYGFTLFSQDQKAFDFQVEGNHLFQQGNFTEAMKNYNQAIEIYKLKSDLGSISMLGKCYYFKASCKQSLEDYRGAITEYNNSILAWNYGKVPNEVMYPSIYYYRGICKLLINDKDGACKDWSEAGELGYTKAYEQIKKNCIDFLETK